MLYSGSIMDCKIGIAFTDALSILCYLQLSNDDAVLGATRQKVVKERPF